MARKKKLKIKELEEILKKNSKNKPFNIDNYDKQSIIDCKKEYSTKCNFYIVYLCCGKNCNNIVHRNLNCKENLIIKRLIYCKTCITKQTNMKKYGVESTNQLESVKKKKEQTTMKHYGVKHPAQAKEVLDKMKETSVERYGVENYAQTEECQEKMRQTNLKRYGVENYVQSDEWLEKSRETWIEKYGETNPNKVKEVRDKIEQTCLDRYGVRYTTQLPEMIDKSMNTKIERYGTIACAWHYMYDSIYFDSSWEIAFYIYHTDKGHNIIHEPKRFTYYVNGKKHNYFPDFKVGNKYYELKGEQFIVRYKNGKIKTFINPFGGSNEEANAKYKCLKEHNVTIIDCYKIQKYLKYVNDNYGENYIEQYRLEKS